MKTTTLFLALMASLSFLLFGVTRTVFAVQFNQHCGGYLERAANANTVELAAPALQTGISYIEQNELTSGYTSIFYKTPDEDVGFWYTNLKQAQTALSSLGPTASDLEKSNMLIKLKESIIAASGGHGEDELICPDGISVYPYNLSFMLWGTLSFLAACVLFLLWAGQERY